MSSDSPGPVHEYDPGCTQDPDACVRHALDELTAGGLSAAERIAEHRHGTLALDRLGLQVADARSLAGDLWKRLRAADPTMAREPHPPLPYRLPDWIGE